MSYPRQTTTCLFFLATVLVWGGCRSSTPTSSTTPELNDHTAGDADTTTISPSTPTPYAIANEEEQLVRINVCTISCSDGGGNEETLWLRRGEVHRIHFTTGGAFSAFEFPVLYRGETSITWRAGHAGSIVINGETVGFIFPGDAAMNTIQPPASLRFPLGNITVRDLHEITPELVQRVDRMSSSELVLSLQFESGIELDLAALEPIAPKIRYLHIAVRAPRASLDLTNLPRFPNMHTLAIADEYGDLALTNVALITRQRSLSNLELTGTVLDAEELADVSGLSQLTELSLSAVDSDCNVIIPRFDGLIHLRRLRLDADENADEALAAITGLDQLQVLELAGAVSDEGLGHLATHDALRRLSMHLGTVTDTGAAHFRSLTALTTLELQLDSGSEGALSHLGSLGSLQSLTIDIEALSDAGATHLATLAGLEHLDLDDTGVTDNGLSHISGLTNLRRLSLERTAVSDAGLVHLSGLTALQTLDLKFTSVGDQGMSHLSRLGTLQRIFLLDTRVGDAGLAHLSRIAGLRVLDLGGTQITNDGMVHLSRLRNLVGLNLSSTGVTHDGVETISTLINLRSLDLSLGRITGRALSHVARLTELRSLAIIGTEVGVSDLVHLDALQHLWLLEMQYSRVYLNEVEAYQTSHPSRHVVH